jgi:hypothetical protein
MCVPSIQALTATYGTVFQFGTIADTICKFQPHAILFSHHFARSILIIWYLAVDIASGSSTDYAYMGEGVVYAYALELRDTGVYGNFYSERHFPMVALIIY